MVVKKILNSTISFQCLEGEVIRQGIYNFFARLVTEKIVIALAVDEVLVF